MKNRSTRSILYVLASVIGVLLVTLIAAFIIFHIRSANIRSGETSFLSKDKYSVPVSVDGVEVIKQDVSCGYAVLEMFSAWSGHDLTEESLYDAYGKVVTSTGWAFCEEMNNQFPEYTTVMHKYLTDAELIDQVYDTLSRGFPVPVEWAALYGDEWTLHYSLITGMDIPNDRITVANPYGYWEELTVAEFLDRTSFDAFKKMPLFLKFGFAFGVFEKNTVFSVDGSVHAKERNKMETKNDPAVTFINNVHDADVWILPQTEANLKTTVWGTATLSKTIKGESSQVPLCEPGDDGQYIFRMIDTDHFFYSANSLILEAGWSLEIKGDDLHSVTIEVSDENGELQNTYEVFAARL